MRASHAPSSFFGTRNAKFKMMLSEGVHLGLRFDSAPAKTFGFVVTTAKGVEFPLAAASLKVREEWLTALRDIVRSSRHQVNRNLSSSDDQNSLRASSRFDSKLGGSVATQISQAAQLNDDFTNIKTTR